MTVVHVMLLSINIILPCFDTVGWMTEEKGHPASEVLLWQLTKVSFWLLAME